MKIHDYELSGLQFLVKPDKNAKLVNVWVLSLPGFSGKVFHRSSQSTILPR